MPFTPTDYLPYDFANRRHIGPSPEEMAEMLQVIGVDSLDQLIAQTVPESIRSKENLEFGKPNQNVNGCGSFARLPRKTKCSPQ